MISLFLLQAATSAPAGSPAGAQGPSGPVAMLVQMAPLILIFGVFYFLLIRPQQQRQKQLAEMVSGVEKGDKVVTNGGLVGTVWAVKEDTVVVQVGDTRLDFVKSSIVSVTKPGS
jgi:preprotein translocase subunit YajC